MRYLCILLFFFNSCSLSCQTDQAQSNHSRFIIISNVGSSNYFVAPLVISVDSVNDISYKKGFYDLHAKFKGFKNIVVSSSDYQKLHTHLNVYKDCNKRAEKFIKEEQAILILDYRDNSETDCRLLTVKSISAVLYTLKILCSYLKSNDFDHNIVTHIAGLYEFYINTYDYNKEYYKSEITCPPDFHD